MKKVFIPIENRPVVAGSYLSLEESDSKHFYVDHEERRTILKKIANGNSVIDGLDVNWAQEFIVNLFPNLKA